MSTLHRLSTLGIHHDDFQLIIREEAVHRLQRGDAEQAVLVADGFLLCFALVGGGRVENGVAPHGGGFPLDGIFELLVGLAALDGRAQGLYERGVAAEIIIGRKLAFLYQFFLEVVLQAIDGQLHGSGVPGGEFPGVGLAGIINLLARPVDGRTLQLVEGITDHAYAFVAGIAPDGFFCPFHLLGCGG